MQLPRVPRKDLPLDWETRTPAQVRFAKDDKLATVYTIPARGDIIDHQIQARYDLSDTELARLYRGPQEDAWPWRTDLPTEIIWDEVTEFMREDDQDDWNYFREVTSTPTRCILLYVPHAMKDGYAPSEFVDDGMHGSVVTVDRMDSQVRSSKICLVDSKLID